MRLVTPSKKTKPRRDIRSIEIVIPNKKGLHARASAQFVRIASNFRCKITVTREGTSVGGTSIMGLMMLGAAQGQTIHLETQGDDADAALAALVGLIKDKFGEGE